LHARPSPKYRAARSALPRVIATPTVAKHRLFTFLAPTELADHQLIIVAREDLVTFGILQSTFHQVWSLGLCTWLGVGNDPRYTPSTTLETFPFPEGLTPDVPPAVFASDTRAQKIAKSAGRLNELRENWINPPELTDRVAEILPGYPDRIIPKNDTAAIDQKKRTLTNLYNVNPPWLQHASRELDEDVASAYGWTWPLEGKR
jgi:type II restriction/modification system DNA methylase subunit YeeA